MSCSNVKRALDQRIAEQAAAKAAKVGSDAHLRHEMWATQLIENHYRAYGHPSQFFEKFKGRLPAKLIEKKNYRRLMDYLRDHDEILMEMTADDYLSLAKAMIPATEEGDDGHPLIWPLLSALPRKHPQYLEIFNALPLLYEADGEETLSTYMPHVMYAFDHDFRGRFSADNREEYLNTVVNYGRFFRTWNNVYAVDPEPMTSGAGIILSNGPENFKGPQLSADDWNYILDGLADTRTLYRVGYPAGPSKKEQVTTLPPIDQKGVWLGRLVRQATTNNADRNTFGRLINPDVLIDLNAKLNAGAPLDRHGSTIPHYLAAFGFTCDMTADHVLRLPSAANWDGLTPADIYGHQLGQLYHQASRADAVLGKRAKEFDKLAVCVNPNGDTPAHTMAKNLFTPTRDDDNTAVKRGLVLESALPMRVLTVPGMSADDCEMVDDLPQYNSRVAVYADMIGQISPAYNRDGLTPLGIFATQVKEHYADHAAHWNGGQPADIQQLRPLLEDFRGVVVSQDGKTFSEILFGGEE